MTTVFEKGEKVKYVGKGFIGYDPEINTMIFIKNHDFYRYDLIVEYNGREMNVRITDIEKIKKDKTNQRNKL